MASSDLRERMQESSMCDMPGPSPLSALPLLGNCSVYGVISSPTTPLDSPCTQSELSPDSLTTFSEQEDEILRELVKRHGTKKWHIISAKMQKKTPRECRKRWRTYLHMCMNKSSWSAEEDHLLLQGHNAFGNRWTEIAKMVPGRTDNAVKNRYNALCTKRSTHRTVKAGNGYTATTMTTTTTGTRQHQLAESWNYDTNSHQYEQDVKRAKRIAQDEEERAATMAYLKSNLIFETTCSRLDLCIDEMPQVNYDLNRTRVSRKQMADIHHPHQNLLLEANGVDESTSPKYGAVDMDEVMGWLLVSSQTPTPTFDCSGNSNSNSTVTTSCTTPLTSPLPTILSTSGIADPVDPFGAEPHNLCSNAHFIQCLNTPDSPAFQGESSAFRGTCHMTTKFNFTYGEEDRDQDSDIELNF